MEADRTKIYNRLKRIRGQIDGIIKMVEEDKYCLDISAQIMAANSALNSTNKEVLSSHLRHCVVDSLENGDKLDIEAKINEIDQIIMKLGK